MKKEYVKIGFIAIGSIAAIYGGYRLFNYIKAKNSFGSIDNSTAEKSDKVEKATVKTPSFNGEKLISKGSKGSEVKTIQLAINNIIHDMSKATAPVVTKLITPQFDWATSENSSYNTSTKKPFTDVQVDKKKESTRQYISNLKPLKVDGVFGKGSASVLKAILGKESTTYNEIRNKRISLAKEFGLGNPYSTK